MNPLQSEDNMKIAITSCANIKEVPEQTVWRDIGNEGADLLLLVGDQIYYNLLSHDPGHDVADFRQRLLTKYEQQWAEPHFKGLLESGLPWTAIWDDHDYAWNNAGGEVDDARKAVTTELFLQFQSGTQVPVRSTVHHDFSMQGVHFIQLDCRSWRDKPGPDATPLGLAQEEWLWKKLREPAKAIVVSCGSPFSFGSYAIENYPAFAKRLITFLTDNGLRIFFVGGDIHDNTYHAQGPIIELVSSGVARKYLFTKKRNYALLTLDFPNLRAKFDMVSEKKRLSTHFDLSTWEEI
jgi:phosphodiesterase/alkaline phosphatase D-like protein